VTGPRFKVTLLAALGLVGGLAVAGCDSSENADLAKGRTMFVANCGNCHTLAEAGTTATIGPDLDAAFADARASGMDQDTIEGVVADQIEHPRQTSPDDPTVYMPAGLVEGQDLENVSAYVGSVAGVPGIQPPEAPGGPGGQVFANNGCASCHTLAAAESTGTQGPNLDDVIPGMSKGEIETSIIDPNKNIAQGFSAGIMPENYGDQIDPKDLKLLVDFIYTNAGKPQKGG
jgi:mono/diheme cytochrome c family protein